jgi:hypothetical protein
MSSSQTKSASGAGMNFGVSMEGMPSRGGPPETISEAGTLALKMSNPLNDSACIRAKAENHAPMSRRRK